MKNINKMMGFHINKNFYSPDKNCKRFWWGFSKFAQKVDFSQFSAQKVTFCTKSVRL